MTFLPSGLGHVKGGDSQSEDAMMFHGATRIGLIFHFFFQGIGAIIGGLFADNIGRRKVILFCLIGLIFICCLTVVIDTQLSILINGIGGGFFVGGLHSASSALFMESCSASSRHFQTAVLFCMQGVSHVAVRLIATAVIYFSFHVPNVLVAPKDLIRLERMPNGDLTEELNDEDTFLTSLTVHKLDIFKAVIIVQIIPTVISLVLMLWKSKESKIWLRTRAMKPPALKPVSDFLPSSNLHTSQRSAISDARKHAPLHFTTDNTVSATSQAVSNVSLSRPALIVSVFNPPVISALPPSPITSPGTSHVSSQEREDDFLLDAKEEDDSERDIDKYLIMQGRMLPDGAVGDYRSVLKDAGVIEEGDVESSMSHGTPRFSSSCVAEVITGKSGKNNLASSRQSTSSVFVIDPPAIKVSPVPIPHLHLLRTQSMVAVSPAPQSPSPPTTRSFLHVLADAPVDLNKRYPPAYNFREFLICLKTYLSVFTRPFLGILIPWLIFDFVYYGGGVLHFIVITKNPTPNSSEQQQHSLLSPPSPLISNSSNLGGTSMQSDISLSRSLNTLTVDLVCLLGYFLNVFISTKAPPKRIQTTGFAIMAFVRLGLLTSLNATHQKGGEHEDGWISAVIFNTFFRFLDLCTNMTTFLIANETPHTRVRATISGFALATARVGVLLGFWITWRFYLIATNLLWIGCLLSAAGVVVTFLLCPHIEPSQPDFLFLDARVDLTETNFRITEAQMAEGLKKNEEAKKNLINHRREASKKWGGQNGHNDLSEPLLRKM